VSLADKAPSVPLADVKWRVDSEPKNGRARFVPHMDSRIAAALMDEWVGPGNWSDEYRTVTIAGKEALLCTVSVWDGEKWVAKQDVGTPPHTEPQKGGISDAFKRCVAVKWGAGRNVYELPTLWAPCKVVQPEGKRASAYANDETLPDLVRQLKRLGYDAAGVKLEAHDEEDFSGESGAERSTGRQRATTSPPAAVPEPSTLTPDNVDQLNPPAVMRELKARGVPPEGTVDTMRERLRELVAL
jgi:hypothetical protein